MLQMIGLLGYWSIKNPPVLSENETEINIPCKSNYTVTCKGGGPLSWTYFSIVKSTKANISESVIVEKNYTYQAILNINNASYQDVKYYYCHYKDKDYNNRNFSTPIYIFVNGKFHFFFLIKSETLIL